MCRKKKQNTFTCVTNQKNVKHRERLKNHYMNQELEMLNISRKNAFSGGGEGHINGA